MAHLLLAHIRSAEIKRAIVIASLTAASALISWAAWATEVTSSDPIATGGSAMLLPKAAQRVFHAGGRHDERGHKAAIKAQREHQAAAESRGSPGQSDRASSRPVPAEVVKP